MKTNRQFKDRLRKGALVLFAVVLIVYGIVYVILVAYQFEKVGFSDYRSPKIPEGVVFERAKSLWDWLSLLVIPLVLTFGALFINYSTQKSIKLRDEDQARAEKEKTEKRENFERWVTYDRA